MATPPNIILITLDTMRADRVGRRCRDRLLAPNITAIAERGRYFTRAVAAGVPTYFSFPVIFGGGLPLDCGKTIGLTLERPTFVEHLKRLGYRTAAVVSSNPYLSRFYRYDRGFDVFEDFFTPHFAGRRKRDQRATMRILKTAFGESGVHCLRKVKAKMNYVRDCLGDGNPILHRESRGEEVTRLGLSVARELEERAPFFLWLHYMDLHGYFYSEWEDKYFALGANSLAGRARLRFQRFRYTDRWTRLILESEHKKLGGAAPGRPRDTRFLEGFYDASVMYVDRHLGPVLDWAERSGRTVSIITSDHGEEFFEHGRIGHAPFSLSDEVVRVPLVVHGPGVEASEESDWVSHSSLAPTIMEIAGGDAAEFARAPSLFSTEPTPTPVFTESLYGLTTPFPRERLEEFPLLIAAREGMRKYVWWEEDGTEVLYDLGADPSETVSLVDEPALADASSALRASVQRRAAQASVADARAELRRRVRNLSRELPDKRD